RRTPCHRRPGVRSPIRRTSSAGSITRVSAPEIEAAVLDGRDRGIKVEALGVLLRSIALGRRWLDEVLAGTSIDEIASREDCTKQHVANNIPLVSSLLTSFARSSMLVCRAGSVHGGSPSPSSNGRASGRCWASAAEASEAARNSTRHREHAVCEPVSAPRTPSTILTSGGQVRPRYRSAARHRAP
ncbi:MAG: hypothetical protein K0Q60_4686, partial [Microvirga sp.]|nr:hypothetical protein [Microvirga sp.]